MHDLFSKVLSERDLSHAGDLFSVHDKDIVDDLSEVLGHIGLIVGVEDYLSNNNDQSVVEICITRVTTAIRETGSIEKHTRALVSLWEICLQHNLKPLLKDEDPPHAKIASDIMSCLFMNYSKKCVMELAMPVAVKFLHQGNKELARNMSSYLSLVAIENSSLLALHTNTIIHSIIEGNHSLTRVLLQIYRGAEEPEPINQHIPELLQLLPACDNNEKTNILQLVGLVAKHDPQLLSEYMEELVEYLNNPSTAQVVLSILVDLSSTHAESLVQALPTLVEAIQKQPSLLNMAAKVLSAVGKLKKAYAKKCVGYLMSRLSLVPDQTSLPSVLIEVKSVADRYPGVLAPHFDLISQHEKSSSTAVRMLVDQLKEDVTKGTTLTAVQDGGEGTAVEATDKPADEASDDELPLFFVKTKSSSRDKAVHSQSTLAPAIPKVPNDATAGPVLPEEKTPDDRESAAASADDSVAITSAEESSLAGATAPSSENVASSLDKASPPRAASPEPTLASKKSQSLPRRLDKGHLARDERSSTRSEKLAARSGYRGGVQRASLRMEGGRFGLRGGSGIGDSTNGRHSSGTRDSSIQQYLAQRHKEITTYIESIVTRLPIPNKCHVQETKSHPRAKLEFYCAKKSDNCVFDKMPFRLVSRRLEPWIHLMFLHLQTSSSTPIALDDSAVQDLKASWEKQHTHSKGAPNTSTFTRIITQGFPNLKVQSQLIDELRSASYFDVFAFNEKAQGWLCFLCNNPDQASDMQTGGQPMIEGCLKEKKVRWKLFRRWKTRYFTLAGERLVSSKSKSSTPTLPIELRKIHSVKTLSKRDSRQIPRAFEIFTDDKTYVLKTKDGPGAQQWVQCLTLAIRQAGSGSRQPIST